MTRKVARKGTRGLVLDSLEQMRVNYEIVEESTFIIFHYQGETYHISAENRSTFITIGVLGLMSVDVDDLDEVNRMRKAINDANNESSVTFFFMVNKELGTITAHCKKVIPFMKEITELDDYLKTVLHEMSREREFFDRKMTKLRNEGIEEDSDEQDYGTRKMFLKTLTKMGCPYEIDRDDEILFNFQGGRFIATVEDKYRYIRFIYPAFQCVDCDDVPAVSRLRKAINNTNTECETITAYRIDEENKVMYAYGRMSLLFSRELPDHDLYLRTELLEFFKSRHYLEAELFKLTAMEASEEE